MNIQEIQTFGAPFGLMFHHFHNQDHPYIQGALDAKQMDEIIIWLKNNFNLVRAQEWHRLAVSDALSPEHVCLTFDDGLKSQVDIAAPILKAHDLTGFWFTYTSQLVGEIGKLELYRYYRNVAFSSVDDFYDAFYVAANQAGYAADIEEARTTPAARAHYQHYKFYSDADRFFRYVRDHVLKPERYNRIMDLMIANSDFDVANILSLMLASRADMKALADDGHIFGLHSHTHPTNIAAMNYAEQNEEYTKSKGILEGILGEAITCAAYPNNSYNDDSLEIMRALKIEYAFRADMVSGLSNLEIPRIDHADLYKAIAP